MRRSWSDLDDRRREQSTHERRRKSKQKKSNSKNHRRSSRSTPKKSVCHQGKLKGLLKHFNPLNRTLKCKRKEDIKSKHKDKAKTTSKCFCSYCIGLSDAIPDHCKAFPQRLPSTHSTRSFQPRSKYRPFKSNSYTGSSTEWSEPSDNYRSDFSSKATRPPLSASHWRSREWSKWRPKESMSDTYIPRSKRNFTTGTGTRSVFRSQYITRAPFRSTCNWATRTTLDCTRRATTGNGRFDINGRRTALRSRNYSSQYWTSAFPTTIRSNDSHSSAEGLTAKPNSLWMGTKRDMYMPTSVRRAENIETKCNYKPKYKKRTSNISPEESSERKERNIEGNSQKETGVGTTQETSLSSKTAENVNSETPLNTGKKPGQTKQPNAKKQKTKGQQTSKERGGKKECVAKKKQMRLCVDSPEAEKIEEFSRQLQAINREKRVIMKISTRLLSSSDNME